MEVCSKCRGYLGNKAKAGEAAKEESAKTPSSCCSICLGVWTEDFRRGLAKALQEAVQPYGAPTENHFSQTVTPPAMILPGDLAYRFHVAASKEGPSSVTASQFAQDLKNYGKNLVSKELRKLGGSAPDELAECAKQEEQGHLCVHVVVTPRKEVLRPAHLLPKQPSKKRNRRRDFESQGGDPRMNLEKRLQNQGIAMWSMNKAIDSSLPQPIESDDALLTATPVQNALDFHMVVWRRPFYLKACYTKTRRDVSQTPFVVTGQGKRRKLGVTSVEEEILPVVSRFSGGISTINNDPDSNKVLFGMAKFHASGREDMDVCMLLPEANTHDGKVTGRPFVLEIVDALRLPSVMILREIVHEINHTRNDKDDDTADLRSYGRNPRGVGISSDLQFVPSSSFKNLQAETESKVKYYGCLCWSKEPLPGADQELNRRLGTFPLELHQRTPVRVLHRRANAVRVRHVLTCQASRVDNHYFRLHLSTDAGTYVKEFCRGDLGRTVPSLATLLGCKTDILELDCEGIQAS